MNQHNTTNGYIVTPFGIILMLSLIACNEHSTTESTEKSVSVAQTTTPTNVQQKTTGTNPPTMAMIPGSTPIEDTTSSWKENLHVPVFSDTISTFLSTESCPDRDGDGFVDAKICGDSNRDPANLDCDDNNPEINPKIERYIPGGAFVMGSASSHAGADEKPVHIVYLSGYCVDTNEVSNNEFAAWLKRKNYSPQGSDIRNFTKENNSWIPDDTRGDYPAEGVTWSEANEYCIDSGKSLPTEAEWEKVARGGCEFGTETEFCDVEDIRPYPWGKDIASCDRANHQLSATGMPKLCVSDTQIASATPTGNGPYGHTHLAGNVWEYVLDVWHPSVYTETPRVNPKGPQPTDATTQAHVLRGGGWNTFSTNMRVANRFHDLIMGSASGFRCARRFVEGNFDDVSPMIYATIQGSVSSTEKIEGRALYITAFQAEDADAQGMLAPGRSPIAEIRLTPSGSSTQTFSLDLPHGTYILSAALDAGTGAQKDDYISASGSGGFGKAKQNPVVVDKAVEGIEIVLQKPSLKPQTMQQHPPRPNGTKPNIPNITPNKQPFPKMPNNQPKPQ